MEKHQARWAKLQTALAVILLSGLIWVFAEQAVTKQAKVDISIELGEIAEDILVQFLDDQKQPLAARSQTVKLAVEGPTVRINALQEDFGKLIPLDIKKIGIEPDAAQSKEDWVPVRSLLGGRLYSKDGQSYLQVTGAEPQSLHILVTKLVRRPVPVKVYDQDGVELTQAIINPAQLEAFVPPGRGGQGRVTLSAAQQLQAVQDEITVAKVTLPHRVVNQEIRIRLPESETLQLQTIRQPRLGIVMPYNMIGRYQVLIDNYASQLDEYNLIKCQGSPETLDKYQKSDIHLILKINESDLDNLSEPFSRPLEYYLPQGYGQIEVINEKQIPMRFELKEIEQLKVPGPG